MAKSNQFVVDLGDAKIPEALAHQLEQAIRRAALATLADHDLHGDIGIRIPPDLRGIYLDLARLQIR
ncbi:MAG: hypothetical protein ACJ8H8_36135 [Geminicoccaceae bacterium]